MKKNLYILLLIGLLSLVLSSPTCYAATCCNDFVADYVQSSKHTEAISISKGSDAYAAQVGIQLSVPQQISERTVRTYSFRPSSSFSTSLGRRLRHFTSFSNHSSWRIFPTSTPFFCTTSKLFYVYALREIIR